jgi:O-antigen/teichoic acid export membrane protein
MIFWPSTKLSAGQEVIAGAHRAFFFAREIGRFASVQVVVQVLGLTTGILLVRLMEQREYALFTVANTMQGTMNVLADIGISIGVVSIGGRVWQNGRRFGELVRTGLTLRRNLGLIAGIVITPLLYYMLRKNGASIAYTFLLIAAVWVALAAQLSIGVLEVVPRLRSDIRLIQQIDLTAAFVRLTVVAVLAFVLLNAGVAVFVGCGALWIQHLLLRRYVTRVTDLATAENPEDRRVMLALIRQQAANAIFYCFQGQIAVLLITIFGHRVTSVAEVGALGRLAMIYAVLGNMLMNILVPAFARCQNPRQLRWIYLGIVAAVAGLGLIVLGAALFLPREFLLILGRRYLHLQHELVLMVGGATLNMMTSTLWLLNAARAWTAGSWINIPLTIATQLLLIPFVDFSTVSGVLTFNLISALPSLLLNIGLSYRGFGQPIVAETA